MRACYLLGRSAEKGVVEEIIKKVDTENHADQILKKDKNIISAPKPAKKNLPKKVTSKKSSPQKTPKKAVRKGK